MAKVKNQILPVDDVYYTDAKGNPHFEMDLFHHLFTDPYPLHQLVDFLAVGKTRRNHKPSTQGEGTPKQRWPRACFVACVARWHQLPRVCPDEPTCKPITSKQNVWDAKLEQGIKCSYFDLYMACCLSTCFEVTVSSWEFGEVKNYMVESDEQCWPCESIDPFGTVDILFTSQQMQVSQYQNLIASGPCPCEPGQLTWELTGGGYLTNKEGPTTTYFAPDENPECAYNPTIQLFCDGVLAAELKIAVNAVSGGSAVGRYCQKACDECIPQGGENSCSGAVYDFYPFNNGANCCHDFRCDGSFLGNGFWEFSSWWNFYNECHASDWCANMEAEDHTEDFRTINQKMAGCCPYELL